MTKQEQINEMAKYVCNVCDFPCADHKGCSLAEEAVEALYAAGYRKVLLDTENGSCIDCVQYAPWQLVERKIEELKSEIKQLEKENAYLLKACEKKFTFNTTQNKKYSVFNTVRKVFADEVKAKLLAIFGKTICSDLDTEDITDIIDELLKEYE